MSKPVILRFLSDASNLQKDLAKIGKSSDTLGSKMGALGKKVAIGIGGAAIAFGALAVKTAMDGEKATVRLETAAKNAGPAFNGMGKAVEDNAGKFAKFGFAVDDVKSSIARIIPVTKSRAQAMKDESVIADVARGRNISLEAATLLVTKAQMGNSTALKKLGIDLGLATGGVAKIRSANFALTKANSNLFYTEAQIHAGRLKGSKAADALRKANEGVYYAQKHLTEVQNVGNTAVDALSKKYGGAASRQAQTFAGKMEALKAEAHNLTEKVGNALIPVLSKLLTYFVKLMDYLQKHRPVMIALGILVGTTLVAAFTAWAIHAAAAAVATLAAAAPVIAIVAAIGLLIAAAVLVWTKWDTIWNWIKDHKAYAAILAILMPIPAFFILMIGALKYLYQNWSSIWDSIKGAWDASVAWIKNIPNVIGDALLGAWNGIKDAWDTSWKAVTDAWGGTVSWVKSLVNDITGAVTGWWHGIGDGWDWTWGLVKGAWSGVTGWIKGLVTDVTSGVTGLWHGITDAWDWAWGNLKAGWVTTVSWITGLPAAVSRGVTGMWDGIFGEFKGALNAVIRGWNNFHLSIPSIDTHIPFVGKIGGFEWDTPNIPELAAGGIISRPTLAMIGEGREPEVVTPLSRLGAVARAAGLAPTRREGSGSGGVHIEHMTVTAIDPREAAGLVASRLSWAAKTGGY